MKKENLLITVLLFVVIAAIAVYFFTVKKTAATTGATEKTGTPGTPGTTTGIWGWINNNFIDPIGETFSGWKARSVTADMVFDDYEIGAYYANSIQEHPELYGMTYAEFENKNPGFTQNGFENGNIIFLPENLVLTANGFERV